MDEKLIEKVKGGLEEKGMEVLDTKKFRRSFLYEVSRFLRGSSNTLGTVFSTVKKGERKDLLAIQKESAKKEIIKECKKWLRAPYGLEKMEWAYQEIPRKILVEKLLTNNKGEIPIDYKMSYFDGELFHVRVFFRNNDPPTASTFDKDWNYTDVKKITYPKGPKIEKPKNFDEMKEIGRILSKDLDFVRVDFYNLDGDIYFGELTHYVASGTTKYEPESFDFELGKHWKIEPDYWKK